MCVWRCATVCVHNRQLSVHTPCQQGAVRVCGVCVRACTCLLWGRVVFLACEGCSLCVHSQGVTGVCLQCVLHTPVCLQCPMGTVVLQVCLQCECLWGVCVQDVHMSGCVFVGCVCSWGCGVGMCALCVCRMWCVRRGVHTLVGCLWHMHVLTVCVPVMCEAWCVRACLSVCACACMCMCVCMSVCVHACV